MPLFPLRLFASLLLLTCLACAAPAPAPAPEPVQPAPTASIDDGVRLRAEVERTRHLEREVERLRADLAQAEAAIVAVESGLLGKKTRADAVSATAEARVQVERARTGAPWSRGRIDEATEKLHEAERQLESGYFGAAIFFASRAERVARDVLDESRRAASAPGGQLIAGERVNLRAGPSLQDAVLEVLLEGTPVVTERESDAWSLVRTAEGRVGWVHSSLIR